MMKVFWLFMLHHKLAVLLPHASFINNFCQGVVIRDKVKWLRSDFTACTVSQQTVILPTVIKCALITPTGCCKLRHCNYVPFNRRKCYVQNTPSCQSVCHITSKTKPSVEFLWSSLWQFLRKLSSKRPFFLNRLSDCHIFIPRRSILLYFKQETNKIYFYISRTEPVELETQNFRTTKDTYCRFRSQYCYSYWYCQV